jgi:hypothetical protein
MKPIKFSSEVKMQKTNHVKVFSFFLIAAYLLAACGGTLPGTSVSAGASKVQADVVAFSGTVESINGSEWTVAGQKLSLDPQVSLDPNITVGDEVKVEANVLSNGAVIALKVESSKKDDVSAMPSADVSSTPDPISSTPAPSPALGVGTNASEIFGAVEALTTDTITINGVMYDLAGFTEFKNQIGVGDQVKVHLIANADGTFTVREIETSQASFDDKNNSSGSVSDDGPNHDVNDDNSTQHSNDDSHEGSDNHGGNNGPDDNGGSSNSGSGDD